MVSVCLPSDALLQHLPFYLGFSYLGRGVSLHGCSSQAQPLLLTLDEGYLLTAAPPDPEHGIAPLGPSAPEQPPLLGGGVVLMEVEVYRNIVNKRFHTKKFVTTSHVPPSPIKGLC